MADWAAKRNERISHLIASEIDHDIHTPVWRGGRCPNINIAMRISLSSGASLSAFSVRNASPISGEPRVPRFTPLGLAFWLLPFVIHPSSLERCGTGVLFEEPKPRQELPTRFMWALWSFSFDCLNS